MLFEAIKILTLTAISFLVAIMWMPILLRLLLKYKMGKTIRDDGTTPIFSKLHSGKSGTPTMGGILVWGTTAFLAAVFYYLPLFISAVAPWNFMTRSQTFLPLGVLIFSAIVGFIDDLFNVKRLGSKSGGLKMWDRLILYTLIAIIGAWWFFYKLDWDIIHVPFLEDYNIGFWYVPLFIFIIVATAFSVNETDGLDGLAGGTLMTSFVAYGIIAYTQGKYDLVAFCGVVAGALLAFLWFNIYPAKFFMGDTGAMSLGVTLGVVAMLTNSVLLLPIIGIVFVIESASVLVQTFSKKIRHKKIFLSTPIHHHFEAKGWSEPTIVMRFWVIGAIGATIGLILSFLDRAF